MLGPYKRERADGAKPQTAGEKKGSISSAGFSEALKRPCVDGNGVDNNPFVFSPCLETC